MDSLTLYPGSECDGNIVTLEPFNLPETLLQFLKFKADDEKNRPWLRELILEEDMTFYRPEAMLLAKELEDIVATNPNNEDLIDLLSFIRSSIMKDQVLFVWPD